MTGAPDLARRYEDQSVSTIGWKKRHNVRLANRRRDAFMKPMGELELRGPG